jgi:hypothetical protein
MNSTLRNGIFATALLVAANATAQKDELFEDLRNLYMDEKYEKLITKGEKYLANDDTRKDPTPYLYLSKAYYEISRIEEYAKDYPPEKAFTNALKWATKYRKKDPDGNLFRENELYFDELKKAAMSEAGGLMSDGKFSRAKRYYDAICKFDPEDIGARFMLGVCQMEMKAAMEASVPLKEAGRLLHTRDLERISGSDKKILREGVVRYSSYLLENGMQDSAKAVLAKAKPVLEGDNEFDMLLRRASR